ncbi:MAG: PrsW family intramembrane metalloprotease [Bacilli bacterium]|nr:PrsW family intramembrane metalloprotease [Bacilli bacterium]MBQ6539029.1 PrsW family intramembrane metalloprotease [Bacilli bacterium]
MLKYFIAVLPAIIILILYLIFDKDKNRNKNIKLIILFILGGIGSYLCYRIEMRTGGYFPKIKTYGYMASLFYAVFGVAIFEEGYKWFFTNVFSIRKQCSKLEIMEYAFVVSLGFAIYENVVFYVAKYGVDVAVSRLFTAIPLHLLCAIIMGMFLIKDSKKIINNILALVVPTMIHALYNSFLYMKIDSLNIYGYLVIVIVTFYIFYKYVKIRLIKE